MDGNGRWAKQRGLPVEMGHKAGVDAMREVIRESGRLGINVLSLYAFSTENWRRDDHEVGALMALMLECFRREVDELHEKGVRVRVIGDPAGLPDAQRLEAEKAMARTAGNTGLTLNLALNYGARAELAHAARQIARDAKRGALDPDSITDADMERAMERALYTADTAQSDVDAVIRTSGEVRLSNFLLWQSAYAEIIVTDTLWPDFTVDEYHATLRTFAARGRRFGGRKIE